MNIYIIGNSGSGKTSVATELARLYPQAKVVKGSGWLPQCDPSVSDTQSRARWLTSRAIELLQANPTASLEHLRGYDITSPTIIDGLRNSQDFVPLFRPLVDWVVLVSRIGCDAATAFERTGLASIQSYLGFLTENGLLHPDRYVFIRNDRDVCSLERAIQSYMCGVPMTSTAVLHQPIGPFRAWISKEFLFGGHDVAEYKTWVDCSIVGIGMYPGHLPTFDVMVEGQSLFNYVPCQALTIHAHAHSNVAPSKLAWINCPDHRAEWGHGVMAERDSPVWALLDRIGTQWVAAKYQGTIDWPSHNVSLNLVFLESGSPAFIPNYRLNFGRPRTTPLERYAKIRSEFKACAESE